MLHQTPHRTKSQFIKFVITFNDLTGKKRGCTNKEYFELIKKAKDITTEDLNMKDFIEEINENYKQSHVEFIAEKIPNHISSLFPEFSAIHI